jgi:hypothetical protein
MTQQFDVYGQPLAGGQLYIIQAGTVSTPQNAYSDTGLSTALPYPITLDAAGRVPQFFLDNSVNSMVKIRLQDRYGVVQLSSDGVLIIGPAGGGGGGGGLVGEPSQLIQTGMMMFAHSVASIEGFVRLNGRTIGSVTSGASERQKDDTLALFLYLWPDVTLTVSGGRGPNAAADWGLNKNISLPDWRGYAIGALDDMGNTASGRISSMGAAAITLGGVGGSQTNALALANLPPYTPTGTLTITASGSVNLPYNPGVGYTVGGPAVAYQLTNPNSNTVQPVTVNITGASFTGAAQGGSSTAFNILDPRKNITFYIKL